MQEEAVYPNLGLIVAVARNRAIGKDNRLLWHLSDDLKRFKALTTGHTIIMGRKTYESFPKRPLPDRFHLVLSRTAAWKEESVLCVPDVAHALAAIPPGDEAFVIGGGQVYAQFLPFCSKAYVTEVDADFPADTFFPELPPSCWQAVETGAWQTDSRSGLRFRYVDYARKPV